MRLTERTLKVWQTSMARAVRLDLATFLGFDTNNRWQWRCFVCDVQCTHGYPTAAAACDGAREHFAAEHPRAIEEHNG